METLNRIEKSYRELIRLGKTPLRMYSGNPNEHGIFFPKEILIHHYSNYFHHQKYEPHPKGLESARLAIQKYYQESFQNGFQEGFNDVCKENILLTSGTSESFFYLFSLLTQAGDNILTPNPGYPLFDSIASLLKIELKPYHLKENENWAVDLEHLKNQTNSRTKAIILISPHNPTGSVLTESEIHEIVSWANHHQIPIICDEVFSEFYFGNGRYPRAMSITKPNLCFTLNGISKMLALPALKLSWIVVSGTRSLDSIIDRLETMTDTFLSCHIPIQEAFPFLLEEGKVFLKNYTQEVLSRRDLALQALSSSTTISFNKPLGGFYMMLDVNSPTDDTEEDFVIKLMNEGVFFHPGYFYDYEKKIHLVLSFLTHPQVLQTGLKKLISLTEKL